MNQIPIRFQVVEFALKFTSCILNLSMEGDNILVRTTEESSKRDIWLSLPSTRTSTILDVRACYNARVVLYTTMHADNPSYEIVLGAKSNSVTQVFVGADKEDNTPAAEWSSPDILSCYEYRTFWISWKNGYIEVAKRSNAGQRLLEWQHDEPASVHAVALSTGAGTYGNWKFSRKTCEIKVCLSAPLWT